MAGAWDRRKPPDDRQPNRSIDYSDPFGAVLDVTGDNSPLARIYKVIYGLARIFGLTSLIDLITAQDDGTFNPAQIALEFFRNMLKPQTWFQALTLLLGIDLDDDEADTNPASVWSNIALSWLKPLNIFADNGLFNTLKTKVSGLFSQLLTGTLFSRVPIAVLTSDSPNLFLGTFTSLAVISDNPKWTFDPAVTRSADGTGSAKTVGNSTLRALRSVPVAVVAGKHIDFAAYVKSLSLTGSGAVRLDLVRFSGTIEAPVQIGIETLAAVNLGTGTHDWTALLKPGWVVPSDGTALIAARLVVEATVTGGSVWFDDVSGYMTDVIEQNWIGGLTQKFLSIFGIFGAGQNISQMQEAWQNLIGLFGFGAPDDVLGALNHTTIWQQIANSKLNPLGIFANLIGGKLPDTQKPAWLQNLTDGIGNLFFRSSNTDLGISNALDSLNGIWGAGQEAQGSADNANIGVQIIRARLDAPGVVGFDEFDYASANTLPADKYSLTSTGPGAGNYGPNGKGQLVWKPSGLAQRVKLYKQTATPLGTDNGAVTGVWSTKIKSPLFSTGYGYLLGRCNSASIQTRIQAAVSDSKAYIQVVNGGTVTTIGASQDVETHDGDVWEFFYGTLTNPYLFWLKQNGTTVMVREDTGHISQYGSDYRQCGLGGLADNYGVIFQIAPPTWNGWTWRDQNLAAAA